MIRAVLALGLLLATGPAAAHALLDHASPPVGSTVGEAPAEVRIWFSMPIVPGVSKISVQDVSGRVVDGGDGRVDPSDASLLRVSLPALGPGSYKVTWQVESSGHGHVTNGDFVFTVAP